LIDARVIISMVVIYNANAIVQYDRRRSAWLPSVSLDMEYDNINTEY